MPKLYAAAVSGPNVRAPKNAETSTRALCLRLRVQDLGVFEIKLGVQTFSCDVWFGESNIGSNLVSKILVW